MVDEEKEARLDRLFHALADRTRRAILTRLGQESGVRVGDLAEPFDMSLNAVSKHLKVLEAADLIRRERDGRLHRCSADFEALTEVAAKVRFYQSFWEARFDDMEDYLREQRAGKTTKTAKTKTKPKTKKKKKP